MTEKAPFHMQSVRANLIYRKVPKESRYESATELRKGWHSKCKDTT